MWRGKLESKFSLAGKPFQGLAEKSILITYSLFLEHLNKENHGAGMSLSTAAISQGGKSFQV